MGWTQDDITEVYRIVKKVAKEIYTPDKSRVYIAREIQHVLKNTFGYKYYYGRGRVFKSERNDNKKFKRFVKNKYDHIGLPSKEINMLRNMIESVVESLEYNEISLDDLKNSVTKMNILASRAKNINTDCDDIIRELEKISSELENPPCQVM